MKKVIVIGVIALFIVVGFQSSLAVEPKVSTDNIEKVEDCDCQQVSDINLVKLKSALNRLKVYTRILSRVCLIRQSFLDKYIKLTNFEALSLS